MHPTYGFKVKLNHEFPEKWSQFVKVRWRQLGHLIMLGLRYIFYWMYVKLHGRTPLMDYLNVQTGQQIYGIKQQCESVPLGGIGSGTIGRGFKGEFCRYQLRPGIYNYKTVHGNQFIVTIKNSSGKTVYQKVLTSAPKPKNLKSWDWSYDGKDAEYTGLYPRSWTTFNIPSQNIALTCRQISPVIPDNYKDSCMPCGVFVWTVENNSDEEKSVSIAFTFQNGVGEKGDKAPGCYSEYFRTLPNCNEPAVQGVLIHHKVGDMPYTYAIAATEKPESSISCLAQWNPLGQGEEVWAPLYNDGKFSNENAKTTPTKSGQLLGAAVCGQSLIPSKSSCTIDFALAWDMPKIHFDEGNEFYYRFYTRAFRKDGNRGCSLVQVALLNYPRWEKEIEEWQKPVLDDSSLPDWYKSALFNETYYVSDGGSVWLDLEDAEINKLPTNDPRKTYGRFAYLEGHEYRMFNTYDVHFYASFALAKNWPKLQAVLQRDFADTVKREDPSWQWHLFDGDICARKKKNSIPHDVGDPGEEPFVKINAYPIHDVSEWRDLDLKYVLQVCRDYVLTRDMIEFRAHWPNVLLLMRGALRWDLDGDGLIENHGSPDQTYDTWTMTGASAYCGSLWLAALQATSYMAAQIEPGVVDEFVDLLNRAKTAFERKLWNGRYYNFDSSQSDHAKSIMSDQLCGLWYILCCNLPNQIIPVENAEKALKTIYDFNVMKFNNGKTGAVNGMMPDGTIDIFTIQSEEMWSGVVYAYTSLLLLHGMDKEAFATAEGLYNLVYHTIGMGYQTPEALYEKDCYRSIAYMRPLSIWSMQLALDLRKQQSSKTDSTEKF